MGIFDIFKKNEDSQDNVPQEQEVIIESESMVCGLQAFVEKNENFPLTQALKGDIIAIRFAIRPS